MPVDTDHRRHEVPPGQVSFCHQPADARLTQGQPGPKAALEHIPGCDLHARRPVAGLCREQAVDSIARHGKGFQGFQAQSWLRSQLDAALERGSKVAAQLDKAAVVFGQAGQVIAGPLEGDRFHRAAQHQRQDQPPIGFHLLPPGGRDIVRADSQDDPVVGCFIRVAITPIGTHDPDPVKAGRPQVLLGGICKVLVDLDGHDPAGLSHNVSHQGRIVAGPRADLEHAVSRLQAKLFEHDGHDGRLGG